MQSGVLIGSGWIEIYAKSGHFWARLQPWYKLTGFISNQLAASFSLIAANNLLRQSTKPKNPITCLLRAITDYLQQGQSAKAQSAGA